MKPTTLAPVLFALATEAQAAPQYQDPATRFAGNEAKANARVAQLTGEMNADLEATLCQVAMTRYPKVIEEMGEKAAAELGRMPHYDAPEGSELATTGQEIKKACESQVPAADWQAYQSTLDTSWANYYATVVQAVTKKFEALNRALDQRLGERLRGDSTAGESELKTAREYSVALVQMITQTGKAPEDLLKGNPYAREIRNLGLDVTAVATMEEALSKTHQALALLAHYQEKYTQTSNPEEQQQLLDAILFLGAAQYKVEGNPKERSQLEEMSTEAGEVQMGPAFTLTMDRPEVNLSTDSTPTTLRKGSGVWLAALEDSLRMATVAGTYGYMSAYPHLTPQEAWDLAIAGIESSYGEPANRNDRIQCETAPFLSQRFPDGTVYVPDRGIWKALSTQDETHPRYVPMSIPDQMLVDEMARFTGCTDVEQAIWLPKWEAPTAEGKKKRAKSKETQPSFRVDYIGVQWGNLPSHGLACEEWTPQNHHVCETMLNYFDANGLSFSLSNGYREDASRLDLRVQGNTLSTDPEAPLKALAQAQVALELEGAQK